MNGKKYYVNQNGAAISKIIIVDFPSIFEYYYTPKIILFGGS